MNTFKEYFWISFSTIQTIQSQKGLHILHLIYAWLIYEHQRRKVLRLNTNLLLSSSHVPGKQGRGTETTSAEQQASHL